MKKLFAFLALALSMNAFAGNVEAGKAAAQKYNCASCHGADFNSPIDPSYPIMGGMAKPLSKKEIGDIAAYLASLPGSLVVRK